MILISKSRLKPSEMLEQNENKVFIKYIKEKLEKLQEKNGRPESIGP